MWDDKIFNVCTYMDDGRVDVIMYMFLLGAVSKL
jgi:hypothetical protein